MIRKDVLQSIADLRRDFGSPEAPAGYQQFKRDALWFHAASAWSVAQTSALAGDATVTAVEDAWPEEVHAALEQLGLGERYDPQALEWVVKWLGDDSARGLVSSVKGRLFEMHVEAMVESGSLNLPGGVDGLSLATSTVQPGWDAEAMVDGQVVGVVQMKAVASARELESHFRRYPDIPDVIVTTEVAAEATAHGMSVIDSGINNEQLTEQVANALDSLDLASAVHELVPEFALLVSALAAGSRLRRGDDPVAVSKWLVAEVGIAGALHALGLAAELATGTAFVRPVVTLSAKGLVSRGRTAAQATAEIEASRSRLDLLAARQLTSHQHRREPRALTCEELQHQS